MSDNTPLPEDFNPWLAVDALMGVTRAISWYVSEGPAAERPMSNHAHAGLVGLAWTASRLSAQLSTYFRKASEAGLELPDNPRQDNVQEKPGAYRLN